MYTCMWCWFFSRCTHQMHPVLWQFQGWVTSISRFVQFQCNSTISLSYIFLEYRSAKKFIFNHAKNVNILEEKVHPFQAEQSILIPSVDEYLPDSLSVSFISMHGLCTWLFISCSLHQLISSLKCWKTNTQIRSRQRMVRKCSCWFLITFNASNV